MLIYIESCSFGGETAKRPLQRRSIHSLCYRDTDRLLREGFREREDHQKGRLQLRQGRSHARSNGT
jgi:hypothetical protein